MICLKLNAQNSRLTDKIDRQTTSTTPSCNHQWTKKKKSYSRLDRSPSCSRIEYSNFNRCKNTDTFKKSKNFIFWPTIKSQKDLSYLENVTFLDLFKANLMQKKIRKK